MASLNCVIYQISSKDTNITESYIGSTYDVRQRMWGHKSSCNNPNSKEYNYKVYQFIREHGGWNNWKMAILEKFTCISKFEKLHKEREYIQYIKPTLNKEIPANFQIDGGFNRKEWGKEWYKQNKEKRNEQKKEYYNQNKEKTLEKMKTKYICECGSSYSHCSKQRHKRTNKHQQYITESVKQIQEMQHMMQQMKQTIDQMQQTMNDQMELINSLVVYRDGL